MLPEFKHITGGKFFSLTIQILASPFIEYLLDDQHHTKREPRAGWIVEEMKCQFPEFQFIYKTEDKNRKKNYTNESIYRAYNKSFLRVLTKPGKLVFSIALY